jgi:hypothetical protein
MMLLLDDEMLVASILVRTKQIAMLRRCRGCNDNGDDDDDARY